MPEADFFKRERYFLPEQWIIEKNSNHYMTYFGSIDLILDLLPSPPRKVLDAGCGSGRVAYELVKRGYQVTGFDYSSRAIQYARILVPEAEFHVLDLTNKSAFIAFEDYFDIVMFREVLEHIDPLHHDQILEYFRSLLGSEGMIVLTVPTKRVPRDPSKHYVHFDQEEIIRFLERRGFGIVQTVGNIRYGLFYRLVFESRLASIFYALLAPPVLKILLGKIYAKFFNRCSPQRCGRLIIAAEKRAV